MSNFSPLLNALSKFIRMSGKKVIRDFSEIEKLQSYIRQSEIFVQEAISRLEKDVHIILKKIKPDLKIITFEDKRDYDCWIIDIIDSSRNFSRGIDNFSINISLQEENKIKTNIFYNPIKDETYCFQKGLGGYKNDTIKIFKKKKVATRESGSICSDIGFIASGKIECYIFLSSNPNLINQVSLILSETGGVLNVLDFDDKKIYIASNNYIGNIAREMIKSEYELK